MGVVYKAQDLELDRIVALKFISRDLSWGDEHEAQVAQQRFLIEARAASALDHPNIATIHTIDRADDGQVFIVMSYYEGETLREHLRRGKVSPAETESIFRQVVHGMAKAHDAGIVHRDLKPGNILLTADGLVKVIDFGLAKLGGTSRISAVGTTLGTVGFMSPEQLSGDEVDARADVWSLGALLYEMLTGRPAFDGPTIPAIMHAVMTRSPVDALSSHDEVPAPWQSILRRALHRNLEDRYATAGAMEADLERAVAPVAGPTRANTRRQMMTLAVAGLAVVVAGTWMWKRTSDRAWVSAEAIPQLRRLIDEEKFAAAATLAERARRPASRTWAILRPAVSR